MAKHQIHEIHAQECQCDRCAPGNEEAASARFLAERADIYRAAHALLMDVWAAAPDDRRSDVTPQDVLIAAEFLTGDNLPNAPTCPPGDDDD